jgi:hypothetical protein
MSVLIGVGNQQTAPTNMGPFLEQFSFKRLKKTKNKRFKFKTSEKPPIMLKEN